MMNMLFDFALGEFGFYLPGELLIYLRAITVNPALVTSGDPGQEGLHRQTQPDEAPALLLLIGCQKSRQDRYTAPNRS
jgi:hypothetical protein